MNMVETRQSVGNKSRFSRTDLRDTDVCAQRYIGIDIHSIFQSWLIDIGTTVNNLLPETQAKKLLFLL